MSGFPVALLLFGVALALAGGVYGLAWWVAVAPRVDGVAPFLAGNEPVEHAFSRFHVRWYALTMIYLAFEMEMLFMYPWTLVVSSVGVGAVVEMFAFLGILLVGVGYAWREGALRWT